MKKDVMMFAILIILVISGFSYFQLTGMVSDGGEMIGPTQAQISCMETCSGCVYGDATCMQQHSVRCGAECKVDTGGPPEPADEGEACMQKCVAVGCDDFDISCQNKNMGSCEDECDMIGEPEARSEEEQCIRDCINKIDPNIQCSSGTFEGEGETGNEACQKCAKSCEHLYSGPCLSDEEWTEKENVCYTQCEHCYGEPVRGPSGQGWDCTIDIKCADASAEFGDDAGTGEDSWEEGHAPSEDNIYWGNYESNLEVSGSEGTLLIRNTNRRSIGEKVEIDISINEGISLEQKDEKLIVKKGEVEVEIDNNLDKLVISEKGNKREIKNIDIGIEEGKPIYKYEEVEKAKLLGFIPVDKKVKKKVDAENIEMLEENGPWWEFLSAEKKEELKDNSKESEKEISESNTDEENID